MIERARKAKREAPAQATPGIPAVVEAAGRAADDKKALDLVLLDLRGTSGFTDFFLICSGQTNRQVKAIADGIDEALRARQVRAAHTEGYGRANWVLLDYIDFVVHIFTPESRHFYDLERLWGSARRVEWPRASLADGARGGHPPR